MINSTDPVTLASLNMHGGLDRHGEPYDIQAACHYLKSDIITLQEAWRPAAQPDPVAAVADTLGARVLFAPLAAETDLASLHIGPDTAAGSWGIAVLTALPVTSYEVVSLGQAPGDSVHRGAQLVTLAVPGGGALRVVNAHLTHKFTSPVQLRMLIRRLAAATEPTVIVGDLNMPRLATLVATGYRRVVRGRTFPAHRPLIELDHVLTDRHVTGRAGEVLDDVGSDHLPIRAQLSLG